ncbi:hypothetical protein EJ02DRAFT_464158 [Clathrospora elynae]|uniref:Uncharacterized protein n=1 Tax=Clathrospora elynae TaxID=706981 RepID=A0A6A5SX76_9PLEO|nr:hypothetical protein EJ02DRAFT_464158 [Clathrospora elynae]
MASCSSNTLSSISTAPLTPTTTNTLPPLTRVWANTPFDDDDDDDEEEEEDIPLEVLGDLVIRARDSIEITMIRRESEESRADSSRRGRRRDFWAWCLERWYSSKYY